MTSRIRAAFPGWFALLLLAVCAHAAEKDNPKTKAAYLRDLEKVQKALTLGPIRLGKTYLKAGDVVEPVVELLNQTAEEILVPLAPGDSTDAAQSAVGEVHWELRRKDGKPVSPMDPASATKKGARPYTLFRGIVAFSYLKPGEAHKLPVRDIAVTNLNLSSGDYEVVLTFSTKQLPARVIATQVAAFTVDNPNATTPAQVAQRRKEELALRASVSREMMSALRLGELSLSNTNVQKGGELTAGCQLRNPSAKDLLIPPELSEFALSEQWYLTRQPSSRDRRDPLGGNVMALPDKDAFGAGKVIELGKSIQTSNLEPGAYEVAVEVRDIAGTVIGLRKQKFRVVK